MRNGRSPGNSPPGFEWDDEKAEANRIKHEVTFEEAATVFRDLLAEITSDPDHSADERRELIRGMSGAGRLLVVSFTEWSYDITGDVIRIITARPATPHERRKYEENDDNSLKYKRRSR